MEKVISRYFPCTQCNRNTPHLFQKQSEHVSLEGKTILVKMSCKRHHSDTLCVETRLAYSVWLRVLHNDYRP